MMIVKRPPEPITRFPRLSFVPRRGGIAPPGTNTWLLRQKNLHLSFLSNDLRCCRSRHALEGGDGGRGGWQGPGGSGDGDGRESPPPLTLHWLFLLAVRITGLLWSLAYARGLLESLYDNHRLRICQRLDEAEAGRAEIAAEIAQRRSSSSSASPATSSRPTVSIVIPTLNEAKSLPSTLTTLRLLDPPPLEVVVVDGGSTDGTVTCARRGGARVVEIKPPTPPRRSIQLTAGARAARGDVILMLHADTLVPRDMVSLCQRSLHPYDVGTVVTGFTSLITTPKKTYWALSLHNILKTYYLPGILRPRAFARGLRILFGDQAMCVRRDHLLGVGGLDPRLPIMEDADLCVRLHEAGILNDTRLRGVRGKGKLRSRFVETSGRRVERLGNVKATVVHVVIGAAWALGAPPYVLRSLCEQIYRNDVGVAR